LIHKDTSGKYPGGDGKRRRVADGVRHARVYDVKIRRPLRRGDRGTLPTGAGTTGRMNRLSGSPQRSLCTGVTFYEMLTGHSCPFRGRSDGVGALTYCAAAGAAQRAGGGRQAAALGICDDAPRQEAGAHQTAAVSRLISPRLAEWESHSVSTRFCRVRTKCRINCSSRRNLRSGREIALGSFFDRVVGKAPRKW